MPIPQSRVIDLLSAALDYKQAFEGLTYRIKTLASEQSNFQLAAIARYSLDECLTDPIKTNITITLEQKRISLTRRYNESRRAKTRLLKTEIPSLSNPEDSQSNDWLSSVLEKHQEIAAPNGASMKQEKTK